MTEEEALRLKPGDTVLVKSRSGYRKAPIDQEQDEAIARLMASVFGQTAVREKRLVLYVAIRWPELRPNGRRFPPQRRYSEALRHAPEPIAANVYADFLEENGHPEAADLLRKHFPLADGRPD
jgi:uncharacterized protein (TIGR02996 family)